MEKILEYTVPAMSKPLPSATIGVMVVDDHPSTRMGLVMLIKSQRGMEVVGEASDGEEAIEVYEDVLPDVVLMDLRMPGMGGVEATSAILKKFPKARIIVLSTYNLDEDIHMAIQSGAMSYLLKDMSVEEITETVINVHAGIATLPEQVRGQLAIREQRQQLTEREREVLESLVKGRSNKEIASSLCVSDETVKSHLKALFAKLGARDRTEAAISAIRHGIVHLD